MGKCRFAARKALRKLIDSKETISVAGTDGLSKVDMDGSDPNLILLNPTDIETMMSNTSSDLNRTTFGYALTFFHEIGHTAYGGAGQDPPFVSGQNAFQTAGRQEILPNRIRRQLGSNYGQRASYVPHQIKGANAVYYPWSQTSLSLLNQGKIPTREVIVEPIKKGN